MEATLPTDAPVRPSAADRELAYRLGSVLLRCLGADGGAALRAIDRSGITFTQMKVLFALSGAQAEPPTQRQVAESLGLSDASASRAIDGLVRREYARRATDPDDRRVRRVSATAGGRRLAEGILEARLEGLGQFAASLSGPEREQLERALELLIEREDVADLYRKYRKGRGR